MKTRQTLMTPILLTIMIATSATVHAATEKASEPEMSPEVQAEMAAWMELAKPGEHHEHMAGFVGSWKGTASMWMEPGAPPMVNETQAVAKWVMGGRFIEWTHTGDFTGIPFEGMAIEGYNNGEKRYEATWIDNFGTLILFYTGSCSDDGKKREMTTQFKDPIGGGMIHYRSVYTWKDADHFSFTAYMDHGDGEFKNMEIVWERQ